MRIRFKVDKQDSSNKIDHAISEEHLLVRQRHHRRNHILWVGCLSCGWEANVSDNTNSLAEAHVSEVGELKVEVEKQALPGTLPLFQGFFQSLGEMFSEVE